MNWVLITLSATALWAVGNYIDKYVLDKHFRGIGGLTIFSGLMSLLTAIVLFFAPFSHFQALPLRETLIILSSGVLLLLYILPYFQAMREREASEVVPLFQLIPPLVLIISFFLIGEKIGVIQLLGFLLAFVGSVTISATKVKGLFKIHSSLFYMFLSSLGFALSSVLFKFIYLQSSFWTTLVYTSLGSFVAAAALFIFYPPYRREFFKLTKVLPSGVGIILVSESLMSRVAQGLFSFATTLVPVSLVAIVDSTQPAFVLFYGVLLTLFLPKLIKEDISFGNLLKKVVSLALLFSGVYLVSR